MKGFRIMVAALLPPSATHTVMAKAVLRAGTLISCLRVLGLLWSQLHQFVHAEQDEGEKPEAPAHRSRDPAVLIHSSMAAPGRLGTEVDIGALFQGPWTWVVGGQG